MNIKNIVIFTFSLLVIFLASKSASGDSITVPPFAERVRQSNLIVEGTYRVRTGKDLFIVESIYKYTGPLLSINIKVLSHKEDKRFNLMPFFNSIDGKKCILLGEYDNKDNTVKLSWAPSYIWPYGCEASFTGVDDDYRFCDEYIRTLLEYEQLANRDVDKLVYKLLTDVKDDNKIYAVIGFIDAYLRRTLSDQQMQKDLCHLLGVEIFKYAPINKQMIDNLIPMWHSLPYSLSMRYLVDAAQSDDKYISKMAINMGNSKLRIFTRSKNKGLEALLAGDEIYRTKMVQIDSNRSIKMFDSDVPSIRKSANHVMRAIMKNSVDIIDDQIPMDTDDAIVFWKMKMEELKNK